MLSIVFCFGFDIHREVLDRVFAIEVYTFKAVSEQMNNSLFSCVLNLKSFFFCLILIYSFIFSISLCIKCISFRQHTILLFTVIENLLKNVALTYFHPMLQFINLFFIYSSYSMFADFLILAFFCSVLVLSVAMFIFYL